MARLQVKLVKGLVVFLAVRYDDIPARADQLARKVIELRIFPDEQGKMNRSLAEVSGELLIISQFTLYGNTRKGNRPSYLEAAKPELAEQLYNYFVRCVQEQGNTGGDRRFPGAYGGTSYK